MFKVKKGLFLIVYLVFCYNPSWTQSLEEMEQEIITLIDSIEKNTSFAQKNLLNENLVQLMDSALTQNQSFYYPFENTKKISILTAPNNKLRIFTWNIPQAGGTQKYFGFIQTHNGKEQNHFFLTDNRATLKTPQIETLGPNTWHGALYYSIRNDHFNGMEVYTLLGIDMNNPFSSKRIIETIFLPDGIEPVMGIPVFFVQQSSLKRIILEYSAQATMSLEWNEALQMIAFDHLSPMRNDFAGNYQYYVPDFSYDGFMLTPNGWQYKPDIDIRNPERERNAPVVPPTENVDPGFLYKTQ